MVLVKRYNEELSSPEQRKMLGMLRKILGISADIYYEMLWAEYKVESSKELTKNQANSMISRLKNKAIGLGLWEPRSKYAFKKNRYEDLANRDTFAPTPAQLRMIEAMWTDVSRIDNDIQRHKAFNNFIKRITGKDGIRFLLKTDIQKVVKALKVMKLATCN